MVELLRDLPEDFENRCPAHKAGERAIIRLAYGTQHEKPTYWTFDLEFLREREDDAPTFAFDVSPQAFKVLPKEGERKQPLDASYDEEGDTLMIEGVLYSGDLFRAWANSGIPLYEPFMIVAREGRGFTLRKVPHSGTFVCDRCRQSRPLAEFAYFGSSDPSIPVCTLCWEEIRKEKPDWKAVAGEMAGEKEGEGA